MTSLGLDHSVASGGNHYPELSSSVKAVSVKCFAVYLSTLVSDLPATCEHTRLRGTCAWATAEFIHVTDNAGLVLTQEQAARVSVAANTYCVTCAALAAAAASVGRKNFKLRPKFHYFWHLCQFCVLNSLNPDRLACWNDESYLGRVKQLAIKCSGESMLTSSLLRYFIYLGLRWSSRREKIGLSCSMAHISTKL